MHAYIKSSQYVCYAYDYNVSHRKVQELLYAWKYKHIV